jgi:hypothetical protein
MVFKSKSQKGLASVSLTQRYGYHQSKVTRSLIFFFLPMPILSQAKLLSLPYQDEKSLPTPSLINKDNTIFRTHTL